MKKNYIKKLIACAVIATTLISSTVYASSWSKVGDNWNLLNDHGEKLIGWQSNGGQWYYMEQDGTMKIGWKEVGSTWYYLQCNGAMKTGWLYDGGKWYYLQSNGAMKIGWLLDGGKWYYLYSDGSMAFNTVIDGYTLDSSGAWITGSNTGTGTFAYDANLTSQWRAKYGQSKYNGIAFHAFENVLNAYAQGKISMNRILGYENPIINSTGIPYLANNDPYDLVHKVWFDPIVNDWTNIGARFIQNNQVTVKGTSIDDIYTKAKASGLLTDYSYYNKPYGSEYDQVIIYKNSSTGEVTLTRLYLSIGKTEKLDTEDIQSGYNFPTGY